MKLSTKGRYGLRAMMDLAAHQGDGTPVFLSDVAKRQAISEKYLEQIFAALRTAGLIHTVRGRKGGFLLSKPAAEITAEDVISILEGPCIIVDCIARPEVCPKTEKCATREVWSMLGKKIGEVLSSFTLEQLVKMQDEKSDESASMYYI